MNKVITVSVLVTLILTACQKELSNEQGVTTTQEQAEAIVNDTIYFIAGSFTGNISIFDNPALWANDYGSVFHCPEGCSLAYIRFKIVYQKGVSLDSFRMYTGAEYDADADPRVTKSRVKYIGGRGDSSTMRKVHFDYGQGKLLKKETIFDGGLDSTRHSLITGIKFHNIDLQDSWAKTIPDSISILSPEGKPLPVKGFLHKDWPGTIINQVILQR